MPTLANSHVTRLKPGVRINDPAFAVDQNAYKSADVERTELAQVAVDKKYPHLENAKWRVNNLYKITDKDGDIVTFKMKEAQEKLFDGMHYRNVIPKARQLGLTSFVMILMLDQGLFVSNTECGVVAHGLREARDLFRRKILFAYDQLPDDIKMMKPLKKRDALQVVFGNDSSITVGTSLRSGTYSYIHVSELGKIAKKFPQRAEEVVTGTLPAAGKNAVVFIESTAEGRSGPFYDFVEEAKKLQYAAKRLNRLQYKLFFFPWWIDKDYELDDEETETTVVPDRLDEYFYTLEQEQGIELTRNQRAWYATIEGGNSGLGDKMLQENPSTIEEAFQRQTEGAYYAKQFRQIYAQKRIGKYPHDSNAMVHTAWDIGVGDSTAIWFWQQVGGEVHVIDYYENSGEGLMHYRDVLAKKDYKYGVHIAPHDIKVREFGNGAKTRLQSAKDLGIKFLIAPKISVEDGIDLSRNFLSRCYFNESTCEEGINSLEGYRKEWDDKHGVWKDKPLHDNSSNGADAFRYLVVSHPMNKKQKQGARKVVNRRSVR